MIRRLAVGLGLLLALLATALPAVAAAPQFSLDEIETELMCPTCGTRLDLSQAPAANQIRDFVRARQAQGWTKQQVKDALVLEYGESVLASPPASGIGIAAWLLPAGAVALAVLAVGGVALAARRRSREAEGTAPAALDDDLEARVDRALADYDG